jgi:hypothetical protein
MLYTFSPTPCTVPHGPWRRWSFDSPTICWLMGCHLCSRNTSSNAAMLQQKEYIRHGVLQTFPNLSSFLTILFSHPRYSTIIKPPLQIHLQNIIQESKWASHPIPVLPPPSPQCHPGKPSKKSSTSTSPRCYRPATLMKTSGVSGTLSWKPLKYDLPPPARFFHS